MTSLKFGPRVEGYLRTADTLPNNIIPLEVWKRLSQEIMAKVEKSENLQREPGYVANEIREAAVKVHGDEIAVDETEKQGDVLEGTTVAQSSTFDLMGSHNDDNGSTSTSSSHDGDDDGVAITNSNDGLDEALEELNQSSISIKRSLAKQQSDSSHFNRSRFNLPSPHLAPVYPCLVKYSASQSRVKARIPEIDPYMIEDDVWPTHFKLRRHVFQVPKGQPPSNHDENLGGFRVIYYVQNCLRVKDNIGLEAAIHMSRSLQLPLQAFVSVSTHTKACRTMSGIATASALCGLKDSLQKMGIPLLGIIGSPSKALKILHDGLPDGGLYAIVVDDSMHPEHMAALEATGASLPNVLLNVVDSNSIGPLREFHFQYATKAKAAAEMSKSSMVGKRRPITASKGDIIAWCTRWECEAMVWVKREEMKRPKKLSDDLQASLYVDFNFNSAPQPHHKQLFIPSSLYETRGLEIVDWSLLRTTSNSALKSRGSGGRCGEEEEDRSIVTTIIGVTEEVADVALSNLINLLKDGKGYTICDDLTGQGMRGDVLTLVRMGVLSPLRILYEAIREMLYLRDYHTYRCYANVLLGSITSSLFPGSSGGAAAASYKEQRLVSDDDDAWTDEWFCEIIPDWIVTELKLHSTDKRQQCYEEDVLLRGGGHDRLFKAIVKVLKDKGILHPFLAGYMGQAAIAQSSNPLRAMKLVLRMSCEYSMGHAITAEVGSSLICDVLEGNVISVPRTRRSHPIFGKVPMLSVGDVRAKWPDPASFLLFLKSGTLQK